MKNQMIKIATIVPSIRVGDVSYNISQIIKTINENDDASILLYPELALTGYTCADLFNQNLLLTGVEEGISVLIKESKKHIDVCIVVGFPLYLDNSLYNVAGLISNGQLLGIVPKSYIPNYGEFYEGRWFKSGKDIKDRIIHYANKDIYFGSNLLFKDKTSPACIGIEICEDLWVPDKPSSHQALAGANILLNLSASDELIGKQEYRRNMVINQSSSCYSLYAYVSSGMHESSTDLVFSGHSLICNCGKLLKETIFQADNHVETAIINLNEIIYNRYHQNTFESVVGNYRFIDVKVKPLNNQKEISSSELAKLLNKEKLVIDRFPFVPSNLIERDERCLKILKIQSYGLITRIRATGIKTLIIGISGGLDSTLALLVCYEAKKIINDLHIIGYTLPSKGNTSSLTYNNAHKLLDILKIDKKEIAIEKSVHEHLKDIGHGGKYKGDHDITYENAQARMRTYILMDVANMEKGLVIGTGDLSELALGWCTYNGDHMSMYAVNTSIPKTLVKYICKAYASICNNDDLRDVLLSIIDTPITPELIPNKDDKIIQKTEDKIGKYDLNDFFLYYILRYGTDPEELIAYALVAYSEKSVDDLKKALLAFYKRFFSQQFKRSCLPDGPKVGSISLSPRGDLRMPSDACNNLWLEKTLKAS